MNKKITLFLLVLLNAVHFENVCAQAKKKAEKATKEWRYETECMGVGTEGTKLIKVWSYSTISKFSITQAKKNAIHAVVFKGFSGNKAVSCPTQEPLADSPELERAQAAFFSDFFSDGGEYMRFVSVSNEAMDSFEPGDRLKVGKEYKTGVVVTIMYSQLRKYLEQKKIIKSLTNGFQ